jgi:hypothetical protein
MGFFSESINCISYVVSLHVPKGVLLQRYDPVKRHFTLPRLVARMQGGKKASVLIYTPSDPLSDPRSTIRPVMRIARVESTGHESTGTCALPMMQASDAEYWIRGFPRTGHVMTFCLPLRSNNTSLQAAALLTEAQYYRHAGTLPAKHPKRME